MSYLPSKKEINLNLVSTNTKLQEEVITSYWREQEIMESLVVEVSDSH